MLRGLLLACLTAVALSLSPTNVQVVYSPVCTGSQLDWVFDAPNTTTADTPSFTMHASSSGLAPVSYVFNASGSLGLLNHPLGVLKFNVTGQPAHGSPVVQVYDGVLGHLAFTFPDASDAGMGGWSFSVDVDVWTVLPGGADFIFDIVLAPEASPTSPVLCMRIELAQPADKGAVKAQDACEIGAPSAPPIAVPPIPSVIVSLDDDPLTRWAHVVAPRKEAINALLDAFVENIAGGSSPLNNTLVQLLLAGVSELEMRRLPGTFADEIAGVAKASGRNVGSIFILNMMYELTGLCTSFVAQSETGTVLHGRNLDFGLFMGTDPKTKSWHLTQLLRDVLVNVEFQRGGVTLYNSTTYAGALFLCFGATMASSMRSDSRRLSSSRLLLLLLLCRRSERARLSRAHPLHCTALHCHAFSPARAKASSASSAEERVRTAFRSLSTRGMTHTLTPASSDGCWARTTTATSFASPRAW